MNKDFFIDLILNNLSIFMFIVFAVTLNFYIDWQISRQDKLPSLTADLILEFCVPQFSNMTNMNDIKFNSTKTFVSSTNCRKAISEMRNLGYNLTVTYGDKYGNSTQEFNG